MERDFCQRCGSALDPKTGQCPDCSRRRSRGGWIAVAVVAVVICLGIYCLLPGGPLRPAAEAALHKIEAIFAPKPEPALPEPAAPLEHTAPLDAQQEALMTAQDLLIDEYFSPADLLDRLEGYVSCLDPDTQAVYRLRLYGERTFPEIAAALGQPEAAVKTRYYRLMARLRKEFG